MGADPAAANALAADAVAAGRLVAASPVAASAVAAGPVAAGAALAAVPPGVCHEAGDRAGQGHAFHDEGDVEAHRTSPS
jgi:hypothetical protein